jgi:deoxycytidylate deaminase
VNFVLFVVKFLSGEDAEMVMRSVREAARVAGNASCTRSKCGAIIVNGGKIIGTGFNSPPGEIEEQRRCKNSKADYDSKVTDKTCCVHAEQRAIMNALRNNSGKILGSRLYFVRLDGDGEISFAGKPYCTICSKMALDVGIKEFVLYHEEGVCVYDTEEYNDLSFEYS